MYSKEITGGSWYGVSIPEWLRVFDCRSSDDDIAPKAPWGEHLWSSERAEVDVGLKRGYGDNDATCVVSCSTYVDARKADEKELARQVSDMVREATRLREEYLKGKEKPAKKGDGGSCLYMPVCITLANYGWSVISDRSTQIVRAFGAL